MSTGPKFPARIGPQIILVSPAINILQNLYNGLKLLFGGGGTKTHEILLSTGIICDLINVQSQIC